jgi:prophage regulatory protein
MNASPPASPGRFLSRAEVQRETTFSRTTLWRRVKDGSFPPPEDLGGQKRGWPERAVEEWKASRPRAGPR